MSACCSAIAIVPLRAIGSPFAFTRNVILPSPCPSFPDRISIHAAVVDEDHAHSRATATVSSPEPPDELKLDAELVIEGWQRFAVGPVTLVTALLPQETAVIAAITNSRALARLFTCKRNTSRAPATIENDVRDFSR